MPVHDHLYKNTFTFSQQKMELGGDFLSMYVSRTDSQIQQYMNGESAPLSFSPSPNKYDRWSFKTDGSSTNHHDIQMNGNVVCHKRNLVECVEHLSQVFTCHRCCSTCKFCVHRHYRQIYCDENKNYLDCLSPYSMTPQITKCIIYEVLNNQGELS